jgi:hypothetical protein
MLSIVLFFIIVTLLFLGVGKPQPVLVPVPVRVPYSHHDVVLRESRKLTAYVDFVLDGGLDQ